MEILQQGKYLSLFSWIIKSGKGKVGQSQVRWEILLIFQSLKWSWKKTFLLAPTQHKPQGPKTVNSRVFSSFLAFFLLFFLSFVLFWLFLKLKSVFKWRFSERRSQKAHFEDVKIRFLQKNTKHFRPLSGSVRFIKSDFLHYFNFLKVALSEHM